MHDTKSLIQVMFTIADPFGAGAVDAEYDIKRLNSDVSRLERRKEAEEKMLKEKAEAWDREYEAMQRHQEQQANKRRAFDRIFKKYDTNNTGWLDLGQVTNLLTDLDSSTPPGTRPSDEEVKFVIRVVKAERPDALNRDELCEATDAWALWIKERDHMNQALLEYDKSRTGKLEPAELKSYLQDLNGKVSVSDEEVNWVMKEADLFGGGSVNATELLVATAAWKNLVAQKKIEKYMKRHQEMMEKKKVEEHAEHKQCCVIS